MSKQIKKPDNTWIKQEISLLENTLSDEGMLSVISHQIKQTHLLNTSTLQEIQTGIYLLAVRKDATMQTMQMRKISDRAQYVMLPALADNQAFHKLSFNALKNYCHGISPSLWLRQKISLDSCHLIFYFQYDYLLALVNSHLENVAFSIKETLSNKTLVLTNGKFNYPLNVSRIAALAIWQDEKLPVTTAQEIEFLNHRFLTLEKLFHSLRVSYAQAEWSIVDGQMRYVEGRVTRPFDYASLLEDIVFANFETRISEYLSYFRIGDLDSSQSYPTVSVRSPVHLKARPQSLSSIQNGYAIAASVERLGTQTSIDHKDNNSPRAFSLWMTRAQRHLSRHSYRARVIFSSDDCKTAFSLVGDQVSTIALFPSLVKGIFESLNITSPSSIRLIAHSEDVLTIAHDTASWVDINSVNEKATALFRLVSADGADPLSLFEQVLLPTVGVGNFQLKVVPPSFFDLVDTAKSMKHSMAPGHDHYLLGLAFECLHEWGLAVVEFQKALRFDANDPDILHALGCSLMEIGKVEESLPFLKRAFDLMPEDPEIANNWGRSNLDCGHLQDAIAAFERAVKLSPATPDYLKNLGNGYLLAARPEDALTVLNKAVRCDPHFAEAHATLAHLHLAYGDEDQAKKHALIAYSENPVDPNIANILWRLTMGKK